MGVVGGVTIPGKPGNKGGLYGRSCEAGVRQGRSAMTAYPVRAAVGELLGVLVQEVREAAAVLHRDLVRRCL